MTDFKTSDRDVNRAIRSWLREDRHEDVSRIAGRVLDQVDTIPQRRATWWPAWRTPIMNRFLTYGLGTAAVVAVLIIGSNLIGSSGPPPGSAPSASAEPTSEPLAHDELPEGSLLLSDGIRDGVSITVTIPADGWWGRPGQGWFTNDSDPNTRPGTGMIAYGSVQEYYVYGDPCHWQTTKPETPATTVDEVVAALQSQTPRTEDDHEMFGPWVSEPGDISVDGYSGKSITLHAPDVFPHDCDLEQWAYFASEDASPERYMVRGGPDGQQSMQGQTDELWIVDVDDAVVVLDIAYDVGTPQATVDALRGILASTTFD